MTRKTDLQQKITKDILEDLYINKQMTDKQIAKEFNCTDETIRKCRVKYGIKNINRETETQKKLTKDVLIDMYINNQMSDEKIAKALNCGANTVRTYRMKYGISTVDRNLELHQKITKEILIDMYINKNMTDKQIADEIHCNPNTIYQYRAKYGIKTTDRKADLHEKLTKDTLVDKYTKQQMTYDKIAEEFNCNKETIRQYCLKFGVPVIDRNLELRQTLTEEMIRDKYVNKNMTDKQIADEIHCAQSTVQRYRNNFQIKALPKAVSSPQQEVYDAVCNMFISINKDMPEIIMNDKDTLDGIEIDIFIPEYNFGIEFNGGFWHSEIKRDKKYHYNKSALAHEKGIFIYHIFSYEWADQVKRPKILNQIQNLLGLNATKIYARKCEIREVAPKEKSRFLDANHVQGNDSASLKLGLYYNDELVSLMTFARPRFSTKYDWELSRFCSKAGCNVIGGASKLFKHFVTFYMKNNSSIISYSDIAKTKGNLYANLGFTFVHVSNPNYVWWKDDEDFKTRYQCQMKNEVQIMQDRKYYRVYDCGNKAWVYVKNDT